MTCLNPKFERYTTAVVSTAHLPYAIAQVMDRGEIDWVYQTFGYGYRIWTDSPGLPMEIKPIVHRARDMNCRWIEFDMDADEVEGFQTWEW